MLMDLENAEIAPALEDLHDAVARVKAQVQVIRMAISTARDECEVRAIISSLAGIEDELAQVRELISN